MSTFTRALQMDFQKQNGESVTISYTDIKENPEKAKVKALMEGICANGEIFENVPVLIKSATIVTTDREKLELD